MVWVPILRNIQRFCKRGITSTGDKHLDKGSVIAENCRNNNCKYLLQAFSSDSSLQSGLSLQNNSFSMHSPFPQDSLPSGHTGSSVFRMGITFLGSAQNR